MKNYYVIAEKDLTPSQPHSSAWPKIIGYNPIYRKFLFMEGKGHGLMGGEVCQDSASLAKWHDIFVELNAEWFLDFLNLNIFSDENDFLNKLIDVIGQPKTIAY